MKFLAVCRPRDGAPPERFAELVPDEAEALRRLRSDGTLLEAWSPGRPGAVLILECPSEGEAAHTLSRLPLDAAGLLDVEVTPLHDLGL